VHDTLLARLPGGQGEFRCEVPAAGGAIRGFWVQPQGGPLPVSYASLVTLHAITKDAWRGTVEPLSERWSLYLLIKRETDGSLHGYFRNPDMNWRGGSPAFRIVHDRDTLRLLDVDTGKQRFTVGYDSSARQILMDFGRQIALTRRTRDQAVGFFPRTPAPTGYTYRAPLPQAADGWTTARARDVGLSEAKLAALVGTIESTDPIAQDAPAIQSLLVARHGKLVLEEYFAGFDAMRLHDMRSASKTFTSVMLGAAMRDGVAISPDTHVYPSFPNTASLVASNPERARITLGNLLTHSSGLACDDNDDASPGNEEKLQSQTAQPDWYRYTLELPMVHEPGSTYAYCSAGLNLAAGVIAHATKAWLPQFFDRTIAQPLQIDRYSLNLTPTGDMYGGGGVRLRPRDMLKFGQLYLDGGVWHGHRVVDASWVTTSTSRQITNANGSDGFAWHRFVLKARNREYQEYEASGNGGQFIIVVPELDLTVVITAGNYGQYGIWRKFREDLVPQYVLSAVEQR
jgi:CubicO group peptidase (beta-lactamase class C family)